MHDDHVFRVNGLPTPTWPGSEVLEINGTAADMARHYGHNEVGLEMGVSGSAPHWKEINTHTDTGTQAPPHHCLHEPSSNVGRLMMSWCLHTQTSLEALNARPLLQVLQVLEA